MSSFFLFFPVKIHEFDGTRVEKDISTRKLQLFHTVYSQTDDRCSYTVYIFITRCSDVVFAFK